MNKGRWGAWLRAWFPLMLLLLLGCTTAHGREVRRPPSPPRTWGFRVALEDEWGNRLPTYRHRGQTFVLGEPGERHNVRVYNDTAARVEAVVTVDGRDAISGQVGDYVRHRGYVVPAHGSVLIEGFRQSLDQVASFRFTERDNSYSARMGTAQNVGVVGVAVFREQRREQAIARLPHPPRRPLPMPRAKSTDKSAAGAAPGAAIRRPRSSRYNLGTEYGESRFSPVSTTSFMRANRNRPSRLLTVHYDDLNGLEARGIQVYEHGWAVAPPPRPAPQPFPHNGFAPPPPPRW